jgi:acetolactate synthase-1/2/3 large subunit
MGFNENQTATIQASEPVVSVAAPELINGSHAVIQSLIAEGVQTIFGYPGGAIMPVYDAIYDYQDQINHILVRHEQGAAHAAEGFGRITGEVGVCLVTSGPGATNLVTGIADAIIDSTPMVCIIGQVASHLLGTDAFQETDVMGITIPITKWNYQITYADEIPEIIAKAFYIAKSGRPGPVLIDITKDAQQKLMTRPFVHKKCEKLISYHPRLSPKEDQIAAAAKLINQAKRPFLFFGHGVQISNAEQELIQFIEKTDIPAASTLLGLSSVSVDHPNYVGWLGMHGNYGTNVLTNQCDLIIAVGMRFDDRVTGDLSRYAKQAKIVHIEIDPAEIDKIMKADAPVVGDAKRALEMLMPLVKENNHEAWRAEFKKYDVIEDQKITQPELAPTTEKIKMAEVIRTLSNKPKVKR